MELRPTLHGLDIAENLHFTGGGEHYKNFCLGKTTSGDFHGEPHKSMMT